MTSMLHERFLWAAKVVAVQPDEQVLEIGCGAGIFAELLASKLMTGKLTGLDRSASMLRQAGKRISSGVAANNVELVQANFPQADFPPNLFHKIVAFNVRGLWQDAPAELAAIKQLLRLDGQYYIFHQPPSSSARQLLTAAVAEVEQHNFKVMEAFIEPLHPAEAFCIHAVPLPVPLDA